jgi:hypothetical protein
MPKNYDLPSLEEDPHKILGITEDAGAQEIRAAYLSKIKEYPPERCPDAFEGIRDAYNILSDPRRRTLRMLLSADPEASVVMLLDNHEKNRGFVGPDLWLAVMMER